MLDTFLAPLFNDAVPSDALVKPSQIVPLAPAGAATQIKIICA